MKLLKKVLAYNVSEGKED